MFGYVCCWKHWIACGSHFLRFLVKHRHVTKRLPRTHLGSDLRRFKVGGLGLIHDARRFGSSGYFASRKVGGNVVVNFKLMASLDHVVAEAELAVSD